MSFIYFFQQFFLLVETINIHNEQKVQLPTTLISSIIFKDKTKYYTRKSIQKIAFYNYLKTTDGLNNVLCPTSNGISNITNFYPKYLPKQLHYFITRIQ